MKRQKPLPGINMTPMIDVVFQMIIFFICTSELEKVSFDEQITLEWARDAQQVEQQNPLTVTVNVRDNGTISISGIELSSLALFRGIMENTVARHGTGVPVVIRGDLNASHQHIRQVMDVCKSVGIWKVSFAAVKAKA